MVGKGDVMTEADYLKEQLAIYRIVLTAAIGLIITFGLSIITVAFDFQLNKILYVVAAIAAIALLMWFLNSKIIEYKELLDELRRL